MPHKVMVAGHICLDITPRFPEGFSGGAEQVFVPGKLINVEHSVLSTGGALANTGLSMARLGCDVRLNGKVGDDYYGQIVKDLVGAERTASFKTVSGEYTSNSVVLAIPGVDRIFLHNTGTNDSFTADDIDYDTAAGCRLFHFGYPTLMKKMYENEAEQTIEMFKRIKDLGVTTSLDMTLPDPSSESGKLDWNRIFEKLLPYVDIFVPSIEEIAYMVDRDMFLKRKQQAGSDDPVVSYRIEDFDLISDKLINAGVAAALLKSGIRGVYLKTAGVSRFDKIGSIKTDNLAAWTNKQLWGASYKAETIASATGAGDATIAGFLCGFLNGLSPENSLRVANTTGWQNVQQYDALSGIQDWQTTTQMIKDQTRKVNPVPKDVQEWTDCGGGQIYFGPKDNQMN